MGAFLDKPNTEKKSLNGSGNGVKYGLAAMQGWRVEMEDAHCAVTGLGGNLKDWSFFAVFDGHAGAMASEHCAKELLNAIRESDELRRIDPETAPSLEEVQHGIKEGFLRFDENLRKRPEVTRGEDKSGSTAVAVLISPNHYFFANCGDSRAILLSNGAVKYHTNDHKPGNPLERERIQNAGGSVMIQRVNGSLAVSRALGDFEYKNVQGKGPCEQLVSPEPEISVIERSRDQDQVIVLACDGVWDVMSNEELGTYLIDRMRITDSIDEICRGCLDTCLHKGSRDNMSIVIVALESAPTIDGDAVRRERDLDEKLEFAVRELMRQAAEAPVSQSTNEFGLAGGSFIPGIAARAPLSLDINIIYNRLSPEQFDPLLPPGGGLASKRSKVEEIFNKNKEEFEQMLRERRKTTDPQSRESSLGVKLKKTGRVASDDADQQQQMQQGGTNGGAASNNAKESPPSQKKPQSGSGSPEKKPNSSPNDREKKSPTQHIQPE